MSDVLDTAELMLKALGIDADVVTTRHGQTLILRHDELKLNLSLCVQGKTVRASHRMSQRTVTYHEYRAPTASRLLTIADDYVMKRIVFSRDETIEKAWKNLHARLCGIEVHDG
jgi:hypothetical protein